MNDQPVSPNPSSPETAIENLSAQVIVLRRGIEDWQKHVEDWHKRIEKSLPPSYAQHFDLLGKGIEEVADRIEVVAKNVAAIQTVPKKAIETITEEANKLYYDMKTRFEAAEAGAQREEMTLRTLIGTIRGKHHQRRWLIRTGIGAFAVGFLTFLILGRALPFGLNTYLAAGIVGGNRWDAGLTLLQAASEESWQRLTAGDRLVRANADKIAACRDAATKSKKDESCAITVPAP